MSVKGDKGRVLIRVCNIVFRLLYKGYTCSYMPDMRAIIRHHAFLIFTSDWHPLILHFLLFLAAFLAAFLLTGLATLTSPLLPISARLASDLR